MIDDITDVRDVVRPVILRRDVPPAAVRLQARHREPFARSHTLEAAGPRLPGRVPPSGMAAGSLGRGRAPVIFIGQEQFRGSSPFSGYERLLVTPLLWRKIARRSRCGNALFLRGPRITKKPRRYSDD